MAYLSRFLLLLLVLALFQGKTPALAESSNVPLYRRYPPERVVVAEVGDRYILTRQDVLNMVGDRSPDKLEEKLKDPVNLEALERQQRRAEDEAIQDWAVVKTIALLAEKKGLSVSPAEVDERMRQLREELGADNARDVSRGEIRDGLLVDQYILREIQKTFSEEDLRAKYKASPLRYMEPASVRAWHILWMVSPSWDRDTFKDKRKEFEKIRKKAAEDDGRHFQEVAREYTESPAGKKSGGDLGWVRPDSTLPPVLIDTLFKLEPGKVSDIVYTSPGQGGGDLESILAGDHKRLRVDRSGAMHILYVSERKTARGDRYDAYARKRVIDDLIREYKQQVGYSLMKKAPFSIKINATGLRVIGQREF